MYHYQECGLSHVWLHDGYTIENSPYGETVSITAVNELHKVIGLYLVENKPELNGEEIRFLRKEMNLSQKNLAGLLGVGETSVRGWEADRGPIGSPTDRLLRAFYKEHVQGDGQLRQMIEKLNHQERTFVSPNMAFSYSGNSAWQANNQI